MDILSEAVDQHLDFVLLLFGSESMLTTQPKFPLSSSWLSLAPLDGLPSRITNLCSFAKSLFDDALPAARNGWNSPA
jgi:hypothetical protein